MTLDETFTALCCAFSMRVLRKHLRFRVRPANNDNPVRAA
jgi:hypothetical protein